MSTWVLFRLLVDFGLVVLIWMVQRIVYPGFLAYSRENLVQWHKRYTPAITSIVAPLMLLQLGIGIGTIVKEVDLFSVSYLVVVSVLWILTFRIFVPLHGELGDIRFRESVPNTLVRKNWYRTILWTLLFIMSLLEAMIL